MFFDFIHQVRIQPKTMHDATEVNPPDSFSIRLACRSTDPLTNLRSIIETHPDQDARILGESIVYFLSGKSQKMLECYERLIEENPDIPLLYRRAGELSICARKYSQAATYFAKAIELSDEDLTNRLWLSFCHLKNNDIEAANSEFEHLEERVFYIDISELNWTGKS